MIITDELARRLEYSEAADAAGCVEAAGLIHADTEAVSQAAGGGYLTFCEPESPLTRGIGVGMHGPVAVEDIVGIEQFFLSRGAPVALEVCPHADGSLREILSHRGYRITEFNNVLVRDLTAGNLPNVPAGLHVRRAEADDADLYARTVVRGFFGRDEMTDVEYRLGLMLFHMPRTTGYLAYAGDEPSSGGGLSIRHGVASFFGDATLRACRGKGLHTALIAERLRIAREAGCDLAAAVTQPGSASQRNYQRLGFLVAYSRVTMVRDR